MIEWITRGYGERDLAAAIAEYFPDESAEALIGQAAEHFIRAGEADKTMIRGWCIEAYRNIYQRSLDMGDYTNALAAVKCLEKTAKG